MPLHFTRVRTRSEPLEFSYCSPRGESNDPCASSLHGSWRLMSKRDITEIEDEKPF